MKALLLTLFIPFLIFANDSYMGTDGGNIFPKKASDIRMLREAISIDLEKGGGLVNCKFWFVNNGASDSIYVGFPDVQINPASMSEPAKDFKAWVGGMQVEVKRDSLIEPIDSIDTLKNSWYFWKAFFPKGDTILIENQYFGLWGGSYCEKCFSYIIGTGNSWSGPIGEGSIVFHHGNLLSSLFIGNRNWSSPGDLVPNYFEDSTVYEFSNYTPKVGERLNIWFSSYWGNMDSTSCPGFYIPIDSLFHKDEIINELFARHGHVFKSKALRNRYSSKKWYRPKKGMKLTDLPPAVQSYIVNLKSGKDRMMSK